MEDQGREVHLEKDDARAGSTPHVVRYILAISILLAIVLLSAIWITGAVSHESNREASDTPTAEEAALSGN